MLKFKPVQTLTCFAALLLGAGCQTYNQQNKGGSPWKAGNAEEAAAEFTKTAEKNKDNKDTVIWRLEQGYALHATAKFGDSLKAFQAAEDKIAQYDERAKVKLGNETGAMLSNQANLPYEGRDYDRVLLNTYKALDYLALGQPDNARPELIRAYQRQQDAVANNQKRIEKEQEDIRKAKEQADNQSAAQSVEKAKQDPKVSAAMDANFKELATIKAYADYVNPFPVYLDGIYFMHLAADASDKERARKSFERVRGLSGDNAYIRRDLEIAEKVAAGQPAPAMTYVVFETGSAPWRDQFRIDLPVFFIGSGNVPYVGAAFPKLALDGNYVSGLTAATTAETNTVVTLSSMDSVVGQDFKNELPTIITKTLLSTTIKAAGAYAVNKAASDQNAIGGLFAKIVTAAMQAAVNIADTRTWTTLPKEYQFCSFPTPADQKIELSLPNGQRSSLSVETNSVNLIWVRSVNPGTPLIVHTTKLK
jgi:hypothetical protein